MLADVPRGGKALFVALGGDVDAPLPIDLHGQALLKPQNSTGLAGEKGAGSAIVK